MIKKNRRLSAEDVIIDSLVYLFSIVVIIATVYPFFYVIVISFNEGIDTARGGIYFWPRSFTIENYQTVFSDDAWVNAFIISVLRTVIGTILGVALTSIVAYALSHDTLRFRKLYFLALIVSMYFDGGIIPYYIILRSLGLLNTFAVYVVPPMLNGFLVLVMVAFFRELPSSLEESARIDGANDLLIFVRLVVPLSKPVFATVSLFIGVFQWNSWLDSVFFVQRSDLRPLSYLMMEIINRSRITSMLSEMDVAMAATATQVTTISIQMTTIVVTVVPIVLVYPFLQKHFVKGVLIGAVKG
ncbi:MAG: carbohydrate ABC transporter permease [Spirochaetales bacterium]